MTEPDPILCEQCNTRSGIRYVTMNGREVLTCDECYVDYQAALADQYDDHELEEKRDHGQVHE